MKSPRRRTLTPPTGFIPGPSGSNAWWSRERCDKCHTRAKWRDGHLSSCRCGATELPEAGPCEDDAHVFICQLKEHLVAGWRAKIGLLKARWELAVWLRPMVPPHGGDRGNQHTGGKSHAYVFANGMTAREVFEAARDGGEFPNLRWRTLVNYLPLADHKWHDLRKGKLADGGSVTSVRTALRWCREQKMTPDEIAAEKAARAARRRENLTREQEDAATIRRLREENRNLVSRTRELEKAVDPEEVKRQLASRKQMAAALAEADMENRLRIKAAGTAAPGDVLEAILRLVPTDPPWEVKIPPIPPDALADLKADAWYHRALAEVRKKDTESARVAEWAGRAPANLRRQVAQQLFDDAIENANAFAFSNGARQ
ncbi:MAG: hypothetical protein OXU64_07565 [Gemmatimonadota bacterium]|nr:hypothetical protein [Gemmatimonadota bacterium]